MIQLKAAHGANKAGDIVSLDAVTEAALIAAGTAVTSAGPLTPSVTQPALPVAATLAPRALTVPESLSALRDHIAALQVMVARGAKSDIDQIGARLAEVIAWLDAVHDTKRWNPGSVRTITVDPVAEHAAEQKAETSRIAAAKLAANPVTPPNPPPITPANPLPLNSQLT